MDGSSGRHSAFSVSLRFGTLSEVQVRADVYHRTVNHSPPLRSSPK